MTKGNKTTTHKSFSASPRPACSCLCCRNPEKSGAGLSRERAGAKAAWWISPPPPAQSISPRTCPPPPGAGASWSGLAGHQAGVGNMRRGGKGASLEWKELLGRIYQYSISVIAGDQSAQPGGPCQCDKKASEASRF